MFTRIIHYRFCGPFADVATDYLDIFFNNLVGDAQCILSVHESLPYPMESVAVRDGHQQTVGVKYNADSGYLYGVRSWSVAND